MPSPASNFYPKKVQPGRTAAGLDTLTRSLGSNGLSVEQVLALAPARYSADTGFGFGTTGFPSMYLMEIRTGEDDQKPGDLELVYHGTIDGNLPAPTLDTDAVASSATFTSTDGILTVQMDFISYSTTVKLIGNAPATVSSVSPITPANVLVFNWLAKTTNEFSRPIPTTSAAARAYFDQVTVPLPKSTEIVPGQYFQISVTASTHLIPLIL